MTADRVATRNQAMDEFQRQVQVQVQPRSGAEDKGTGLYPNPIMNLGNAFIEIDGKRHNVADLLKRLVEILDEKKN